MTKDELILRTIGLEGGYIFDEDDPGGETKFGISKRSYPKIDIKNLTKEEAFEIYLKDYWNRNNLDTLNDINVAGKVFDISVNQGSGTAAKYLAEIAGMIVTRAITIPLLQKINTLDGEFVVNELRNKQIEHYKVLVDKNPKLKKYIRGWINRANAA